MPVWHTIQSDQIVVMPSGLAVAAIVRTAHVRAVLDPDAATTTIAEPLARRLPNMPDRSVRAPASPSTSGPLTLSHRVDVKLRATYHPIATARFAATLPGGTDLDVGRDILEQEALRLDFVGDRIAALSKADGAELARSFTPLRLTLVGGRYVATFSAGPVAFRADAADAPASVVRTMTYGRLSLPVHDAGHDGRWIGWDAFAGKRIVLDLPHRTIWVETPAG